MPIDSAIKPFYPDNWKELREEVLARATRLVEASSGLPITEKEVEELKTHGSEPEVVEVACCESCGKPNGWEVLADTEGWWSADGFFFSKTSEDGEVRLPDADNGNWGEDVHKVKVVLTVAHLDQDPRGDDVDRLRALCQRCHLAYDRRPKQKAKRERIYAELFGQQSIFGG